MIIKDFTLDEFEPWQGAINTKEKIKEAGKLEEFDCLMDEWFPEGLTITELNDQLWFYDDNILDALGIEYDIEESINESLNITFNDKDIKGYAEDLADVISDFLNETSKINNINDYIDEYDLKSLGNSMDALYEFARLYAMDNFAENKSIKLKEGSNRTVEFYVIAESETEFSEEESEILNEIFENANSINNYLIDYIEANFGWDENEARYCFEKVKELDFVNKAMLHMTANEGGIVTADDYIEIFEK